MVDGRRTLAAAALVASASAFSVAPPLRQPSMLAPLSPTHRAGTPVALLDAAAAAAAATAEAAAPLASLPASSLLLADWDIPGGIPAVLLFFFLLISYGAGKGNMAAGAALVTLGMFGDPDERERSGANENEMIKKFVLTITPSAWKKAYQGADSPDGEPEQKQLLDLPEWMGDEARELVEPEAVECVKQMQIAPIDVPGVGTVKTSYLSLPAKGEPLDVPPVVLIHGFDSSVLEFRYITDKLTSAGLRVEAMEWWTGGFTDRDPFTEAVSAERGTPWDLIRAHQLAFVNRQLGDQKFLLLGASLGGAVAIDFAATHPERVAGLILMDAGGESYAQPNPLLTSLAADPVTNLFQWRATNGMLPYPHVWAKEKGWRQALRAYLKSGGYQNRVGPELIRQVPQPTQVLWGEDDDVLPVEDSEKYREDLPNCVGVQLIPSAQHAPALENPPFVAAEIIKYAKSRVWERELAAV